jgi:hypothetical protein
MDIMEYIVIYVELNELVNMWNSIKEQNYYDMHGGIMSAVILTKENNRYTVSFIKYDS